jgi:hypothetical protein
LIQSPSGPASSPARGRERLAWRPTNYNVNVTGDFVGLNLPYVLAAYLHVLGDVRAAVSFERFAEHFHDVTCEHDVVPSLVKAKIKPPPAAKKTGDAQAITKSCAGWFQTFLISFCHSGRRRPSSLFFLSF